MATTSLARVTDNDGFVYLPAFGVGVPLYTWQPGEDRSGVCDRALAAAVDMADANGAPCGVWVRDGWHTVCEHAPESITPDPCASGWELIAVMDPAGTWD